MLGLLGQGEIGLTGIHFKDLHISSNAPCAIWRTLIDDLWYSHAILAVKKWLLGRIITTNTLLVITDWLSASQHRFRFGLSAHLTWVLQHPHCYSHEAHGRFYAPVEALLDILAHLMVAGSSCHLHVEGWLDFGIYTMLSTERANEPASTALPTREKYREP